MTNSELIQKIRLNQAQRESEIATGIASLFTAAATPRQLSDYRDGWQEGFAAFSGERPGTCTAEYRAGFEAGYLANDHRSGDGEVA